MSRLLITATIERSMTSTNTYVESTTRRRRQPLLKPESLLNFRSSFRVVSASGPLAVRGVPSTHSLQTRCPTLTRLDCRARSNESDARE